MPIELLEIFDIIRLMKIAALEFSSLNLLRRINKYGNYTYQKQIAP